MATTMYSSVFPRLRENRMASSSSATDSYDQYDVFLSFRGEDTRYNFTSHLYDALRRNNIKAFIDYTIDRGDEITRTLERVIDCAKISIVVFSEKYADSTFCLDELVRIMECKESKAQIVLPIFYRVDPLEGTYEEAFVRHGIDTEGKARRWDEKIEQRMKKVERWKSAFLQSLELAGSHVLKDSDEVKFIGKIVKKVSEKLNNNLPRGEKLMSSSMVGQTAADNFEKIWECLMNDEISRVGVYGMGGVGKTTIVHPIFYKVDPSEETYKEAFARHETDTKGKKRRLGETVQHGMKKVERWKSALLQSLELAGWHVLKNSDEVEFIGKIVKKISEKLNNSLPKGEKLMSTSMVGRTAANNFEKIWKCLMNDEILRVGVYGMGGVGKTTIATRINDQLLARVNPFSLIFWVTVSKDLSIGNIQNNIAKMINLDLSKEDDVRQRAAKLRNMLKSKKFVLILDDVWEAFQLEDVGIPPLIDGQKILLTSRSRRVCEMMECKSIEVQPLFKQEALDLFVKESKCQINNSVEWRDIACSIVEECDGLPLAIVVIARKMIGVKEIWNWRNTLRELQKPCEGENVEMEKKVFKVLKFSYDGLRNDKCRECFLYCSLFPEDYAFKTYDLINYWIGMGIIELESKQAEFDKGKAILDELVQSSLLLEDFTPPTFCRWIKMHDVIRDMAHIIVKVKSQFEDPLESVQVLNSTMTESFPYSAPHCYKLKTLVLKGYILDEASGGCFGNMQSLNVLDMRVAKLIPNSITNLENLKMLIINECYNLECIPSIAGLEMLRHLKISGIEDFTKLQKGIERFVNLRVLNLSNNRSLSGSIPNSVVEKLSNLQILNLKGSRVEVEPEAIISLEKLEILKVSFYNLQKLNCYVKSGHCRRLLDYQIIYRNNFRHNKKKGMGLRAIRDAEEWKGESDIFLPYDIQYLELEDWESQMFYVLKKPPFAHLRAIRLTFCNCMHLFTVGLAQQILHNIQVLTLRKCHGLEEIIATEEEWDSKSNDVNYPTILLPNLKVLSLDCLSKLKSIYRGRMDCPSLEFIKIYSCAKLKRLPFYREKEGNKTYPPITLSLSLTCRIVQWDDPSDESMYHFTNNEYGSEIDSESE